MRQGEGPHAPGGAGGEARRASHRFGERAALLKPPSLTQAELAERADLDVSYVSQLERGLRDPSLSSIEAVAGASAVGGAVLRRRSPVAAGAACDAQARAIAQGFRPLDEESGGTSSKSSASALRSNAPHPGEAEPAPSALKARFLCADALTIVPVVA